MSDDWQVGDLALCVDDTNLSSGRIRRGAVYRVIDMDRGAHVDFGPQIALHLEGVSDIMGYAAIRFRKIKPLSDEERDSFLADLREPTRAPEHARATRRPELRPPSVRLREMKASYRIEETDCGQ